MFSRATALIGELLSVDAVLLHGVVSKWLTRERLKMARLSFACNPAATLLPLCYWCEAYDEVCMHPCCLRTCMQPSSPVFDWVDRGRGG